MATRSDMLLNRNPRNPHILNCQRGIQGEANQLWLELEHYGQAIEGRVGFPEVERISIDTLSASNAAARNDGVLVEGRGFIPTGWFRAMVNIDTGVANTGIDWWAAQPGADGNNLRVVYVAGAGALAVAYNPATRTVTVTLAAGGSTAAAVIAAILADAASHAQFNPQNEFGSTGLGTIVAAVASTTLTGGTGTCLRCASLLVDPAGANNAVRYVARTPGMGGNQISVAYTVGTPGVAPVVTVTGQRISVAVDAGVSTANQVIAAVNRHATASHLVKAQRVYNDTGAGTIAGAVAAAMLTNGADGQGLRASAGGAPGVVYAITDETCLIDLGAMAESANTESAVLALDICGHTFRFHMNVVV